MSSEYWYRVTLPINHSVFATTLKMKVDQLKWQTGGKQVLELKLPQSCSGESHQLWARMLWAAPEPRLSCAGPILPSSTQQGTAARMGTGTWELFCWASDPWTEHQTGELRGSNGCKPLDHYSKLFRIFWNTKPFKFCSKISNPVYLLCCGNNQKLPDLDHPNSCWQLPSSLAKLILARNNWISYLLLHNCNKKPQTQHPTLKGGGGQGKVHNWRDNPCLTHVVTSFMWFLLQ